ncbi:MAG: hypothetical protein IJ761_04520 [Bacteroidales bacterium]|nr:hypothetical protein [Bacteroidales bacterium]
MKLLERVSLLLIFATFAATSTAQEVNLKDLLQLREIVSIEEDVEQNVHFEIVALDSDSTSQYFLSLGHLGVGNNIIQFHVDPIFTLYIKLGNTLAESIERIEELIEQIKAEPGTATETTGYISLGAPNEHPETVTITTRKPLLSRHLQFSVQRDGYIRATDIRTSQLKSLRTSLKLYKKLHKKEA